MYNVEGQTWAQKTFSQVNNFPEERKFSYNLLDDWKMINK